ncbi:MAG: GNAT family N-acetyltransferase [Nocardioidaceae bacterium]
MRFPADVPVLTDGDVTLRAHRPEDAEGVIELANDPASIEFTVIPVPYGQAEAGQFLQSRSQVWESGAGWSFAVETEGGGGPTSFAGSVGLALRDPGLAEVGFAAHPGVRGRGVMSRAVALVLDWAFEVQGLHTVSWQSTAGNLASWRVAWRNGFTFEGSARACLARRGTLVDGWRGSLLSTDSREPKTRWLQPVPLAGERVVLRAMERRDAARIVEATNDAASLHWLGRLPFPRELDDFEGHLTRRLLGQSLGQAVSWVVADPHNDDYLATISLFGFGSLDYKSAEFGYIAHPQARRRGVVTEAVRLVSAFAFTPEAEGGLGLERLSLGAADANLPSLRVAHNCGFVETGRDRRSYPLPDDAVGDMVRCDLLRDEFHAAAAT